MKGTFYRIIADIRHYSEYAGEDIYGSEIVEDYTDKEEAFNEAYYYHLNNDELMEIIGTFTEADLSVQEIHSTGNGWDDITYTVQDWTIVEIVQYLTAKDFGTSGALQQH